MLKLVLLLTLLFQNGSGGVENRKFPPGFKYGAGTSAAQVEGAWNEDGELVYDKSNHDNAMAEINDSTK